MLSTLIKPFANALRKARAIASHAIVPIDETLWQRATGGYAFVRALSEEENRRLRLIASDFLSRKTITGAGGQEIDDLVRTQISAQACILVLELGLEYFDGWSEVIVYPSQFMPVREVMDEAGVVHTTRDEIGRAHV